MNLSIPNLILSKGIRLVLLFTFVFSFSSLLTQYYNPAQIVTIQSAKSAFEGDMYLDTVNKNYFIGLTTGELAKIGDTLDERIDSAYFLNDTIFIIEGNDTGSFVYSLENNSITLEFEDVNDGAQTELFNVLELTNFTLQFSWTEEGLYSHTFEFIKN